MVSFIKLEDKTEYKRNTALAKRKVRRWHSLLGQICYKSRIWDIQEST